MCIKRDGYLHTTCKKNTHTLATSNNNRYRKFFHRRYGCVQQTEEEAAGTRASPFLHRRSSNRHILVNCRAAQNFVGMRTNSALQTHASSLQNSQCHNHCRRFLARRHHLHAGVDHWAVGTPFEVEAVNNVVWAIFLSCLTKKKKKRFRYSFIPCISLKRLDSGTAYLQHIRGFAIQPTVATPSLFHWRAQSLATEELPIESLESRAQSDGRFYIKRRDYQYPVSTLYFVFRHQI